MVLFYYMGIMRNARQAHAQRIDIQANQTLYLLLLFFS